MFYCCMLTVEGSIGVGRVEPVVIFDTDLILCAICHLLLKNRIDMYFSFILIVI